MLENKMAPGDNVVYADDITIIIGEIDNEIRDTSNKLIENG